MIKEYVHINKGTCASQTKIVYDDETDIIQSVKFVGGCPGNTLGVAKLCEGRTLQEVYDILNGVRCGNKMTSCPNELAQGISAILKK